MPELELESIQRLSRDLAKAAITLSKDEARYLVSMYYTMQENRIRAKHQLRKLIEKEEPHLILEWFHDQSDVLESQIRRALDSWTNSFYMGRWCKSICGIGPVIAAGLEAHIDINRAPTYGHILRYGGQDPTLVWLGREKAEALVKEMGISSHPTMEEMALVANRLKRRLEGIISLFGDKAKTRENFIKVLSIRPWNTEFKTLCVYKLGESFVFQQNNKNDFYGKLFAARKALEKERNEKGLYAEIAANILKEKRIGKGTDAYKAYIEGRLPDAHIHRRAVRWAVKIFIAHYHTEAYRKVLGKEPPKPYPLEHLGHADYIPGPPSVE